MDKFDFDEWADLYQRDPAAFEARRQTVLALELAKASPSVAEPARATLRRLESQLAGKDDAARIQTSMLWMAASMRLLSAKMQDLSDTVGKREPSALH
ncbi:MAG TPA: DUF3135 domain-containing protein [Quisquiliibacterium sp.]|nr:DUF3135 domain-containing protein [Quisquiliibacterium sp.]HPA90473.1 DUF3135 domain-containing protein [Quisquiliibacterium sp.]HQN10890.1 DUF3135 domain-containing protein [Quisquiliibacterium sp.]